MSLPKTFKASQYKANAPDASALNLVDLPLAAPKGTQIVVKVTHASCNPIDCKVMGGYLKPAGWAMPLPFVPGYDFAGVVAAVGPGAKKFKVGDAVFGVNWGSGKHDYEGPDATCGGAFAEYCTVPEAVASTIPSGLNGGLAASVALVGTTAYEALFKQMKLTPGQKVFITGGSGAVGIAAIQIAKAKGLWVATTASSRTVEFVRTLGADKIVNYSDVDWSVDPKLKGIDAVFDTVNDKDVFKRAKLILKKDGKFASIAHYDVGFNPAAHPPLSYASAFILTNDAKVQDELAEMVVAGTLKMPIDSEFPFSLEGVKKMFAKQAEGKSIGKNILTFV